MLKEFSKELGETFDKAKAKIKILKDFAEVEALHKKNMKQDLADTKDRVVNTLHPDS